MKKTKMLKKNYEFRQVLTKGEYYTGNYIKAFVKKNNNQNNFLGLAISTKAGKANKRNRMKRLLRENYKNFEDILKVGYSIVFLIKKDVNIDEIKFENIEKDMYKILKKAEIIVLDQ